MLVAAWVLGGCGGECSDLPERSVPFITTGDFRFEPSAASSSLPSARAQGPVAVRVDRAAGTVRLRWMRPDGVVTEETWRMRD